MALACLYCSGKENPKMQWLSVSAGKNHVQKHTQDGLPIFLVDPAFSDLSLALLSTSGSTSESLLLNVILGRAKAAKQCLEEEIETSTSSKHRIKQGPITKK